MTAYEKWCDSIGKFTQRHGQQTWDAATEAREPEIAILQDENKRLRLRVLTAAGDDLCRLTPEEIKAYTSGAVQIPPIEEFIPSCRRFHKQIVDTAGVLENCLTLAQMVAENEKLWIELDNLKATCKEVMPILKEGHFESETQIVERLSIQIEKPEMK